MQRRIDPMVLAQADTLRFLHKCSAVELVFATVVFCLALCPYQVVTCRCVLAQGFASGESLSIYGIPSS